MKLLQQFLSSFEICLLTIVATIPFLGKHGRKVKKQDIPIFCSEEEEQEEDMEIEAQQQQSDEKIRKKNWPKEDFL